MPQNTLRGACEKSQLGHMDYQWIVKSKLVNLMGIAKSLMLKNNAMVLKLFYKSRMSTAQIASILGCTEAEVWNVLAHNDSKGSK